MIVGLNWPELIVVLVVYGVRLVIPVLAIIALVCLSAGFCARSRPQRPRGRFRSARASARSSGGIARHAA